MSKYETKAAQARQRGRVWADHAVECDECEKQIYLDHEIRVEFTDEGTRRVGLCGPCQAAGVDPVRLWVRTERATGNLVETVGDILHAARRTHGDECDAAQFLAADMVEALGAAVAVFRDLLAEIEAAREVKA